MRIGLVGTFIRDRIIPWQGDEVHSIGGIFFTVSYLASLAKDATEVIPVSNIGHDLVGQIRQVLSKYRNVSMDGLNVLQRDNTAVTLTYTAPGERREVSTEPMPAIDIDQMSRLRDADAVIINLITGFDISLAALRAFRTTSEALIYLDFHSRALAISSTGERHYTRPDDWREWIELSDILQLNEMEARTLAGLSPHAPLEELFEFATAIVRHGPKVCHITLGEHGSYLLYVDKADVVHKRIDAYRVSNVVDIIGCGDAFQAAFMLQYLKGADVFTATRFAHKVAAFNCTFVGSAGLDRVLKADQIS